MARPIAWPDLQRMDARPARFRVTCMVAWIIACVWSAGIQAQPALTADDDMIRAIIAERIGPQADRIGMVTGIIGPEGTRIVAHGSAGSQVARPLDGDTVFEIGSVTKVFTALLLAEMESRGELHRLDPVARFLPATLSMPARGGRPMTLEHLASHRSGLPQMPDDLTLADLSNRYATYSLERLYAFLSGHQLRRDVGARYLYSNVGASVLGHALALAADSSFDALVRDRIAAPLQMSSTGIALPSGTASRLAQGHNARFVATPYWHLPTLNPAVGLHSTANDLLRLLALYVGDADDAGQAEHRHLKQAAGSLLDTRWEAARGSDIAMGWHVVARDGDEIVAHDGGTNGFRSFLGFRPGLGTGVVVLSNYAIANGVNDIGMHLLDATHPLLPSDSPLLR